MLPEINLSEGTVTTAEGVYYSASKLAALDVVGMPNSRAGVYKKAKKEGWRHINIPGKGAKDGVTYFLVPPDLLLISSDTKSALTWFSIEDLCQLSRVLDDLLPSNVFECERLAISQNWQSRKHGSEVKYKPPQEILTAIHSYIANDVNPNIVHSDTMDLSYYLNESINKVASSIKQKPDAHFLYIESYPEARGAAGAGRISPTDQVMVRLAVNASDWRNYVGLDHKHVKLITVHGDSMKPALSHGDQVLVDTACSSFIDDAIYAIQQGDFTRFKRIKLRLDGSIVVKSDNEQDGFPPETYTATIAADFHVIGRVIPFKFGRFDL